ncbi:RICIN domain-containing protein [Streptomyces sp. NPDC006339]|uniref:RICIN domain-containing protein n=1 Tax=Streptomyces sp. NPDC006339 TaxID=3156755 RepID=UPI0033AD9522
MPVQLDMPWCDQRSSTGYSRFQTCLKPSGPLTVILKKADGRDLGVAQWAYDQRIETHPHDEGITQSISLVPVRLDPALVSVTLDFRPQCAAACSMGRPLQWGAMTWTPGDLHEAQMRHLFFWTNSNVAGASDGLNFAWSVTATSPVAAAPDTATWRDYLTDIRCDRRVGTTAGCVFWRYTPTFTVDKTKYPAAQYFIAWTQRMYGGMGLQKLNRPLHRQADDTIVRQNRSRICNSTFIPNDDTNIIATRIKTDDRTSCDEFPFASSRESGRTSTGGQVAGGQECAQFYAFSWPEGPSGWSVYYDRAYPDPSPPASPGVHCGRANIPLSQNTGVGGDLGRFTVDVRLLDNDEYFVESGAYDKFTPPAAVPFSGVLGNKNSSLVLGIRQSSTTPGADAIQWEHLGIPDQFWSYSHQPGTRIYEIKNENSGQCLAISGSSVYDGAKVVQWPCDGSQSQKWEIIPTHDTHGDAQYRLKNINSGKCLAIRAGSTDRGADAIQWECNGGAEQYWV